MKPLTTRPAPVSLKKLIRRNYLTASLIPVFTIEVMLLILYFGINNHIAARNQDTLLAEVRKNLHYLIEKEARNIDLHFQEIAAYARLLQSEHQRFFISPEKFPVPGSEPEFATAENGVYYKTGSSGCSLFYGRRTRITEKEREKARATEAFDPLFRFIIENQPCIEAVYFNSHDDMNRLCPFIEHVYDQYDPDLKMDSFNFYYLADAQHNPERKPVWTGAYLDPAGHGWMTSCVVPVYRGDFLEGVTGLDVTVDRFIREILDLELPWNAGAFLADAEGTILAMPESVEKILGIRELRGYSREAPVTGDVYKPRTHNLLRNPETGPHFSEVFRQNIPVSDIKFRGHDMILSQSVIPETGWRLMVLADRAEVFAPILELKQVSRKIGFMAMGVMILFYLVFFGWVLRKSRRLANRIAQPVSTLARISDIMWKTEYEDNDLPGEKLSGVGISELDMLLDNFSRMRQKLAERDRFLTEAHIREKMQEKEMEVAYHAGLLASTSSYLHNIGNAMAGLDGRLMNLRRALDAMKQYPDAFRIIREAHFDALENAGREDETPVYLDRLEHILMENALPVFRKNFDAVSDVRNHILQTIRHQQEIFTLNCRGTGRYIRNVCPGELIGNILEDFDPVLKRHKISVQADLDMEIMIHVQKYPLIQGFTNLVKNAIEAVADARIPGEGKIEIRLCRPENRDRTVVVHIRDNGTGIHDKDLPRLFSAGFTTKPSGHGLGIHSFHNFLGENGGSLRALSPGPGKGAEFIVEICDEQAIADCG